MNWLKDDAIYLSSLNAEELKEGLLDLTYLVGGSSGNKEADSRKAQLAEHKIYALIDLLVFYAVDGIPEDMQEQIEGIRSNMLCVQQGGAGYRYLGNLRTSKGACCVGAK